MIFPRDFFVKIDTAASLGGGEMYQYRKLVREVDGLQQYPIFLSLSATHIMLFICLKDKARVENLLTIPLGLEAKNRQLIARRLQRILSPDGSLATKHVEEISHNGFSGYYHLPTIYPDPQAIDELTTAQVFADFLFVFQHLKFFRASIHHPQISQFLATCFPLDGIIHHLDYHYLLRVHYVQIEENVFQNQALMDLRHRATDIVQNQVDFVIYQQLAAEGGWFSRPAEKDPTQQHLYITDLFCQNRRRMFGTRILFLAANPVADKWLRLDKEAKVIDDALIQSQNSHTISLITKWAVRVPDLKRELLNQSPEILHFSGHGLPLTQTEIEKALQEMHGSRDKQEEDKNRFLVSYREKDWVEEKMGVLLFEAQAEKYELYSIERLSSLIKVASKNLQCVILNACYSGKQAEMLAQHVPYVIGTSASIRDQVAITFSQGFYEALGAGRSYNKAFDFGLLKIHEREDVVDQDWVLVLHEQGSKSINPRLHFAKQNSWIKQEIKRQDSNAKFRDLSLGGKIIADTTNSLTKQVISTIFDFVFSRKKSTPSPPQTHLTMEVATRRNQTIHTISLDNVPGSITQQPTMADLQSNIDLAMQKANQNMPPNTQWSKSQVYIKKFEAE